MRSLLFAAVTLAAATAPAHAANHAWTARDVRQLRADLDRRLASPVLRGAHVGLLMIDTTQGKVLYARNADDEFQPASNFKLLVGSAALDRLGVKFQYGTGVASVGTVDHGSLTGNLELAATGDPQLSAADLDSAAKSVAAAGVTNVIGSIYVCAPRLSGTRFPNGWDWDDLPYYYAPVVGQQALEENVVHVYVSPGARLGDPVKLRVAPESSAFTIDNRAITGPLKSSDTTDIERPWDEPRTIRIVGSYPLGAKESDDLRPAVPDPQNYTGDVFLGALKTHGVALSGGVQSGCLMPIPSATMQWLWKHESEPLPRLLADFWRPSDNLIGEVLLKELGTVQSGDPGTTEHGAALERTWLRSVGIDPQTVSISDGSGLSNYDRITPHALVAILQHDWHGKYRVTVLNALPVAGVSGTLKDAYKGTPAAGNVIAKTGSFSHVRTISGFIRTHRHGMITFSFLINDWLGDETANGAGDLAKLRGALFSRIVTF